MSWPPCLRISLPDRDCVSATASCFGRATAGCSMAIDGSFDLLAELVAGTGARAADAKLEVGDHEEDGEENVGHCGGVAHPKVVEGSVVEVTVVDGGGDAGAARKDGALAG